MVLIMVEVRKGSTYGGFHVEKEGRFGMGLWIQRIAPSSGFRKN